MIHSYDCVPEVGQRILVTNHLVPTYAPPSFTGVVTEVNQYRHVTIQFDEPYHSQYDETLSMVCISKFNWELIEQYLGLFDEPVSKLLL